ncbi:MAG: 3-isopropylmalate dehydratase small subunit [Gammaproteobacteria bacterium]|nr:3-isopropylmalate dehydratase small subunit [Gammaproteobacteria bacterium]
MKRFTTLTGRVAPLDKSNVDTDQIIPKQFLKSIRRSGFGDNLFDGWRYLDEGDPSKTPNERRVNPDFVLNRPEYQGASILLARENFGCGSSREHAVWALEEYGFRAVLAPSFADIFHSNCFKNGVLPIELPKPVVDDLFERAQAEGGLELTIDLPAQELRLPARPVSWRSKWTRSASTAWSRGWTSIGVTLKDADAIRAYERRRREEAPGVDAIH